MREHLDRHGKRSASIIFHGGEPLMGGRSHIERIASIIGEVFGGVGMHISVGMQTNLLLFTPEMGRLMVELGMSVGVSVDGPPHVNDVHRVDRKGRPSSARLEKRLALLTSAEFRSIFSGFLCVIDPSTDPVEITRYFLGYEPKGIDFLFPLNNHTRRPIGKQDSLDAAPYGEWLVKAFDYWIESGSSVRIRIFNSIIRMLCGAPSEVESVGLHPVDIVVVETNGDIEAVDSLKSTFEGATCLGYNVRDHDFDTVARDLRVRSRQLGAESLCGTCQKCALVGVCGGGYIPHRYSTERGFDNTSVYCSDLMLLIRHIRARLVGTLEEARQSTAR
jgi:uncharacterized protein